MNPGNGWYIVACAGLLNALWTPASPASPRETVLLVNANVPVSADLAAYYAKRREIPTEHILALDLPVTELMTREDYNRRLRDPLLAWLRDRDLIVQTRRSGKPNDVAANDSGWDTTSCSIKYIVSMFGVPLRIADINEGLVRALSWRLTRRLDPQNRAAVDSELAALLYPPYLLDGFVPNPMFGMRLWPETGSRELGNVLIAARLDGPDAETVRAQIDAALQQERYGLLGRAYFDVRGLTEGGLLPGDMWIEEAYERFLREGFECEIERRRLTFPEPFPMEHAAVYLGWYTEHAEGPFLRRDFRFQPGAVAYHLHSGSAATLRSGTSQWAGPLLTRGAAVTMGAVFEPFLRFTPQLDLFADRLCAGRTFGESAYCSLAALSWQITVVGDPLYRPFLYPLEKQIEHLEADGHPGREWGYLRHMNLLVRQGRYEPALAYGREKIEQTGSLVLRERLGDLLVMNQKRNRGVEEYEIILEKSESAVTQIRVGSKCAWILHGMGKTEEAVQLVRRLQDRWEESPAGPWLDVIEKRITP